jgi:predicted ArsR family transcriptional regulator
VAQPEPVSRDQAADGCGLPRHTAKFHLDRLVEEGLLDVEFRRLSGRRGPGAGRPTKLYRRSARQVEVTLPERHYALAGHILARAVQEAASNDEPVLDAVHRAAAAVGHRLGTTAKPRDKISGKPTETLGILGAVLADHGYEPRVHGDGLTLNNCPFHSLAREHTALVCAMNLSLIDALIDELPGTDLECTLDPAPNRCCVTVARQG